MKKPTKTIFDEQLYQEYGLRVRRQKRRLPLVEWERQAIREALAEVALISPRLPDLMRAAGLTLVSTGGLRIKGWSFDGNVKFLPDQNALVFGGPPEEGNPLSGLAHGLCHWLDYAATPPKSQWRTWFKSDHFRDSFLYASDLEVFGSGIQATPALAAGLMKPAYPFLPRPPLRLVARSNDPDEVAARLGEQAIAAILRRCGVEHPCICHPFEDYLERSGYWGEEAWASISKRAAARLDRLVERAFSLVGAPKEPMGSRPGMRWVWTEGLAKPLYFDPSHEPSADVMAAYSVYDEADYPVVYLGCPPKNGVKVFLTGLLFGCHDCGYYDKGLQRCQVSRMIDHLDRDHYNVEIANLRCATRSENNKNRARRKPWLGWRGRPLLFAQSNRRVYLYKPTQHGPKVVATGVNLKISGDLLDPELGGFHEYVDALI